MGQGSDSLSSLNEVYVWDEDDYCYDDGYSYRESVYFTPKIAKYVDSSVKQPTRGAKAQMVCHCGEVYLARESDIKRGWAKSCSKQCAAIRRDFGKPAATRLVEKTQN